MATEATVADVEALQQGIADVRSDSTATNWCLVNHQDGDPAVIQYLSSGSGGVPELADQLDNKQYMYALVRLTETIDMSETTKFVYITWAGTEVSFTKRGKYGVVSGSVEKHFSPYQVSLTCDTLEEVTDEYLMSKIQETSGTKNKVLDASEGKTRPERGFVSSSTASGSRGPMSPTGRGSVSRTGKQGSQFGGFTAQAKGGSSVKLDESFKEAVAAVRSDEDETVWLIADFPGNDVRKPLQCSLTGKDLNELVPGEVFKPENITLALLRITDVVDDIPTVKFAYILWVGDSVKPMSKGRLSTTKGEIEDIFNPFHVHVQASSLHEVKIQTIVDKVGLASGSKSNVK
ncbi:PREDICTED: uncharacterized protein LOC100634597 [Amphimedon queenslandica]|uniref:Coactosin-like protein n=1 Tax=Amphimedon queenslandica TaxID=400682 RepID=A0A1X7VLR6_AMPQE|nr:PREDICTED: uncharacterized protein LOC100634597 [Amphimedon queenslandica]XP_019863824.1 PREDICTED: uncharacterized protein LOC100634597 [Amphimedon queenslandica]|eukprot:XP_003383653.1 PREDICTED: uncharacterized protein LOC100634597 [Amphimedon queenslandica]